jgi:hypothetical protein
MPSLCSETFLASEGQGRREGVTGGAGEQYPRNYCGVRFRYSRELTLDLVEGAGRWGLDAATFYLAWHRGGYLVPNKATVVFPSATMSSTRPANFVQKGGPVVESGLIVLNRKALSSLHPHAWCFKRR